MISTGSRKHSGNIVRGERQTLSQPEMGQKGKYDEKDYEIIHTVAGLLHGAGNERS